MAPPARPPRFDEQGNPVPITRFAYISSYSTVDNERMNGIAEAVEHITDREARVLLWFIANTPAPDEPVMKSTSEIAARLKMSPSALSRNVKRLTEAKLLLEVRNIGCNRFFRVTPFLCHRGTSAQQREAVRHWNPPVIPGMESLGPTRPKGVK